jgi:hypothetical protein
MSSSDKYSYLRAHLRRCAVVPIKSLKNHCYVLLPWHRISKKSALNTSSEIDNTISSDSQMTFYCDETPYSDICYIPKTPYVEYFKQQIDNLKFSNGTSVNPAHVDWYAKLCYAFKCHLENIDDSYIRAEGYNPQTGDTYSTKLNLIYRTSHRYKKRNIARGYKLIEELNTNPVDVKKQLKDIEHKLSFKRSLYASSSVSQPNSEYTKRLSDDINNLQSEINLLNNKLGLLNADSVTLVTFTGYQRGADYIQYTQDLLDAKKRLHDNIRKHHPKVPYVVSVEAHKTGYIHFHIVYGCNIPEDEQIRYKRLWSETYNMGSYDNGLQFSFFDGAQTSKKEGQREYKNDIDGAVRYLIKYISKSMSDGLDYLEQQKDSLKLELYKSDKGKNSTLSDREIEQQKLELNKKIDSVRSQIEHKQFNEGLYPFHQFLADAYIWYMSKTSNKKHSGVRSFYINPVWNSLIRDSFSHEGIIIFTDVYIMFGGQEKPILVNGLAPDNNIGPPEQPT